MWAMFCCSYIHAYCSLAICLLIAATIKYCLLVAFTFIDCNAFKLGDDRSTAALKMTSVGMHGNVILPQA